MSNLFRIDMINKSFSKAARSYDTFSRVQKLTADELLDRLKLYAGKPECILDLGTGTGYLARGLRKLYPKATVIGIDIAEGMAKHATTKEPWLRKRNQFVHADVHALPIQAASVDLIVSNLMLHWCNDIDRVFKEIARVLKPEAPLWFSTLGPDTLKELRSAWGNDDKPHVHPFIDMHELGDGLLKNGLKDPVMDRHDYSLSFDNFNDVMDSLRCLGVQNRVEGRRKTMTGKTRFQQFKQALTEQSLETGFQLTYEAIYAHAWGRGLQAQLPGEFRIPIDSIPRRS